MVAPSSVICLIVLNCGLSRSATESRAPAVFFIPATAASKYGSEEPRLVRGLLKKKYCENTQKIGSVLLRETQEASNLFKLLTHACIFYTFHTKAPMMHFFLAYCKSAMLHPSKLLNSYLLPMIV